MPRLEPWFRFAPVPVEAPWLHHSIDTEADVDRLLEDESALLACFSRAKGYEGRPLRRVHDHHVLQWVLASWPPNDALSLATVLNTSGSVPERPALDWRCPPTNIHGSTNRWGAGLEHMSFNAAGNCDDASQPFAEVLTYGLNKGAKGYEVTPLIRCAAVGCRSPLR